MAQFRYAALDENGEPLEGTMEESSAYRVTQKLRERGYTVSRVEAVEHEPGSWLRRSARLTWEEVHFVAEELAAITKGNLPLAPAVRSLADELRGARLKAFFADLHPRLERGMSLDEAMSGMTTRVPPLMASLIRAGESSGNLPAVLQLLTGYTASMQRMRHTLRLAFAYPIVTTGLALFLIVIVLYWIVPHYAALFHEFGSSLPWPTRFLIELSDAVTHRPLSGVLIIGLVVAGILLFVMLLRRSETLRQWWDGMRLRMPGIGRVYYLGCTARFCRTLAILLRAGTPVLDALELAAAAAGSPTLSRAVGESALPIANGETVSAALRGTGFFGFDLCWITATGEQRGHLDVAFDSAADRYERELTLHEQWLAALAAPTAIIITGIIVGAMVIALYLPIFTLGDAISGT